MESGALHSSVLVLRLYTTQGSKSSVKSYQLNINMHNGSDKSTIRNVCVTTYKVKKSDLFIVA